MQKQGLTCQDSATQINVLIRCVDYIVVISKTNILSDKIKYFIKHIKHTLLKLVVEKPGLYR